MSEFKDVPELFFTETKLIKQLICVEDAPFLVVICDKHIRLLSILTVNELELTKRPFTFFTIQKSCVGDGDQLQNVEISETKEALYVELFLDRGKTAQDFTAENFGSCDKLICVLGYIKMYNGCYTIGAFHLNKDDQEYVSESTDVNSTEAIDATTSGVLKFTKYLKLMDHQSVIAFCGCTPGFAYAFELIAVLARNENANNELELLICTTTSLEIRETVHISVIQDLDLDVANNWKLTWGESTMGEHDGTSLLFIWNKHVSLHNYVGIVSMSSANEITLKFMGWKRLTLPKNLKKRLAQVNKNQLFIRKVSGTPRSAVAMHAPFQLQWNLIVFWNCGVYQLYAANTDSEAVMQRNETCLILMREFSIFTEPIITTSFVDCDVVLLSSKLALELKWANTSEIVIVSLRSLIDGQAFVTDPTTLEIKLNCSMELEFPAKVSLATSTCIDNTTFVFFTLKKQIYHLRFYQVDQLHNLFTSIILSESNTQSLSKISSSPDNTMQTLFQTFEFDQEKYQKLIKLFNRETDKKESLEILKSNTFEPFCHRLIDYKLLPINQEFLQRFIELGLHSVFKYGISSPNTSETTVAHLLQTISQSSHLSLIVESLSASRSALVSAIRNILLLDQVVVILKIIADWCQIYCILPPALIKDMAPDLPSFERIIDFLGIILDAKFMNLLQAQDITSVKLLQGLSTSIMTSLLMRRHIQKVQGQIFALTSLNGDDIAAYEQNVSVADFVTLDL